MLLAKSTPSESPERTDAELVIATRAGETRALAGLYRRYSQALMTVAFRLLASRQDAEDVVHDVFVGLPEALRKYDERGRLEPWLKRVTVRVALDVLRRQRSAREVDFDVDTLSAPPRADTEGAIALQSAVDSLSSSQRAVLVLKEMEGFSHAEIAGMLGISKGASEVRLHRALATLRALLTKGETR